jgi:Na+-driven multidrug efflux pump
MAFLLQIGRRLSSNFFSLIWIRLIYAAMGPQINSLYLGFLSVLSMTNSGDLGMGGAIAFHAGKCLGEGREKELQNFLASARSVFLMLAILCGGSVLVLSPWLPHWFGFRETAGAGSLPMVFAISSLLVMAVPLNSYISNLNYACDNVVWPVIPSMILLQFNLAAVWLLARGGYPLWFQFTPSVITASVEFWLQRTYVRASHPSLSHLLPLKLHWPTAMVLLESSGWVYLCSLGNLIYRNTDAFLINRNHRIPLGTLSTYVYNYKPCEIAVLVVLTASFVTLPKITKWMASSDLKDQDRVRFEMRRLNQFQALLACAGALAYLAGNDLFMKIWFAHQKEKILPVDLTLQLAFALNLVVTACGDAGIQLTIRHGKRGLRVSGITTGLTGLLNLGLSIVAMRYNSLLGIAMATVLAQSVLNLVSSAYICRKLKIVWLPWMLKGWLFPVLAHFFGLAGVFSAMLLLGAWGLGVTPAYLKEELTIIKKSFRK